MPTTTYDDDTNGTGNKDIIDATGVWSWNSITSKYVKTTANGTDDGLIGLTASVPTNDMVHGYAGDDQIYGGKGNDKLFGDEGDDILYGDRQVTARNTDGSIKTSIDYTGTAAGNDILDGGSGNDKLYGGDGDDTLIGGSGADELHGDGGNDTADYSASAAGVNVNLDNGKGTGGDAQGDRLYDIENLIGSSAADTLTGNEKANALSGGGGDDKLYGGAGKDTLDGGDGNDKLYGGSDDDKLNGGKGNDVLDGGSGKDELKGGEGNDQLFGGQGADNLQGDDGDDTLVGGQGGDLLTGGAGKDLFVYNNVADSVYSAGSDKWDEITDFKHGDDQMDLRNLTNSGTADDLAWGGTKATAHGVWYAQTGTDSNTYTVYINIGEHRGEDDGHDKQEESRHNDDADYKNYAPGDYGSSDDNERGDGHSVGSYASSSLVKPDMAIIVHTEGGPPSASDFLGVMVTAINHAPTAGTEDLLGAVTELTTTPASNNLTNSGIITFSDVDLTDVHLVSATGTPVGSVLGSLTAVKDTDTTGTGTGGALHWIYAVADAAVEYLAAGQHKVESFTITLDDQHGGVITKQIDVTITGTNDLATISGDASGVVTEDASPVTLTDTGTLSVADADAGQNIFSTTVTDTTSGGALGSLSITAAGVWSYSVANASVQYLGAGDTKVETFTVDSSDGTDTQTISVTITGTNDTPDIHLITTDSATASLTETNSGLISSGTLTVTDVDLTDTVSSSITAVVASGTTAGLGLTDAQLLGMLSVTPTSGLAANSGDTHNLSWTYNSGTQAFDYLANGQSLTLYYTVQSTDNHAATDTQTVTVTINGTNDAPVIAGAGNTISYTEQAAAGLIDSALTVTDPDNANLTSAKVTIASGFQTGDVLAATTTGTGISATYDASTHILTLSGNATLAQYQQVMDSVTFANTSNDNPTNFGVNTSRTISWVANDGALDSNTGSSTINITAVNDAPVISGLTVSGTTISFVATDPDNTTLSLSAPFASAFTNPTITSGATTTLTAAQQGSAVSGTLQVTDGSATSNVVGLYLGTSGDNTSVTAPLPNSPDAMYGFGGNDSLTGGTAADFIFGGTGNDTLVGGGGADTLVGDSGNDRITYENGTTGTVIHGDAGASAAGTDSDTLVLNQAATIDLSQTSDQDTGSANVTITGFENVDASGSSAAVSLTGSNGANVLTGGAGADTLTGGAGNDTLTGGASNDTFNVNSGTDNITDLSGSDVLVVSAGATANATVSAAFTATASTNNAGTANLSSSGFSVDLGAATGANGFTVTNTGTAATFTGSAQADSLIGGTGADTLVGGAGSDSLTGGAGADTFVFNAVVGTSSDSVNLTKDTIVDFTSGTDFVLIKATNVNNFSVAANVTAANSSGNYSANLNANGTLTDSGDIQFTSTITFGTGSNAGVTARAATIVDLTGTGGNDTLSGGDNADTLNGGAGADSLTGGKGADVITGGSGADTFLINSGDSAGNVGGSGNAGTLSGYDVITDFATASDILNLQGSPTTSTFASAGSNDSTLTINGATVKSHAITNGIITFDTSSETFSSAVSLAATDTSRVAAALQYLQANDLGNAGDTVAFTATINGTAHTYIFEQVANNSSSTNDLLVDLSGVTLSNISGASLAPAGVSGEAINLALSNPVDHAGVVNLSISGLPEGWSLNTGINNGDGTWSVQTDDVSALTITTSDSFTGAVSLNMSQTWSDGNGGTGLVMISNNIEAYASGNPIFAVSADDHLTASSAADTLVFAQPIAQDTVHNFDVAHDTIDLIGFTGVSGFDSLVITEDANGNAVVTMGDNATITVQGVHAGDLTAANFEFGVEPVSVITGTLTIGDGAIMPFGGVIENSGTIALGSTGSETSLEVLVNSVTLQGGGQVVLSDDAHNVIFVGAADATLINHDNTISGAGQLGVGQMTLVNEGTIVADGNNALVIDTGTNTVANSGTLEATGSGGLVVESVVANTTGLLWANEGDLLFAGAVDGTGSGYALISGDASIEFAAASSEDVSFATGLGDGNGTLTLDASAEFTGTVSGFNAGDALDFADVVSSADTTLAYDALLDGSGGTLTLSDGAVTASVNLLGQYDAAGFWMTADENGGTVLTLASDSTVLADSSLSVADLLPAEDATLVIDIPLTTPLTNSGDTLAASDGTTTTTSSAETTTSSNLQVELATFDVLMLTTDVTTQLTQTVGPLV